MQASINVRFVPERLGAPTTFSLGFRLDAGGGLPPPLTGIEFHYPTDLGIATNGLGVASCPLVALEADGPSICPPDSRMGGGNALVEIPFGGETQQETASIALLAGPSQDGYVRMFVNAMGSSPVIAHVVMPALLLPGDLRFTVPLVESLPGSPYVSVAGAHVTLGGDLTYYERRHGRLVAYRPQGVMLPRDCPRGGFRFSMNFSFLDGTAARAQTVVACPRGR
ncbi:MAG TPA: hypothetical protein VK730_00710 [Solirubrobacteraceae bacterium]|jgi:hypothetical protein|nr:hypothetical protein [Solirubrobacteraceae bacterium]